MSRLEVHPAARWADVLAAELATALGRPGGSRICLPAGKTPIPVYRRVPEALAAASLRAGASTIVLLDEYTGLAVDDPARCALQLRRELIARLVPRPAFVPIRTDDLEPDEAAAAHDAEAARGLDLAVVGLGRNGHVGMNEPGCAPEAPTRAVELEPATAAAAMRSYGGRSHPAGGVTLGINRLLEARELWLIVSGSEKAEMLRAVLDEPIDGVRPASFLRRHPRLRVIADDAAAGEARTSAATAAP